MCETCWVEHGRPDTWNPDIARALELIRAIYEVEPVGAPLHVVLDDWNIEDGHIKIWPDPETDPQAMAAAEELVPLLRRMSVTQRAAALAYHDGLLEVPAT